MTLTLRVKVIILPLLMLSYPKQASYQISASYLKRLYKPVFSLKLSRDLDLEDEGQVFNFNEVHFS